MAVESNGCGRRYWLEFFELYKSASTFYLLGRDNNKAWRLLKIDASDSSELNISDDSVTYSQSECLALLSNLEKSSGGFQFVTVCYGIIGFIKFLGPYYMLVITDRTEIGTMFGHKVYQVTKTEMIEISAGVQSDVYNSKDESRYKRLLYALDLRKDFFFSYSYHIMRSLQKNLHNAQEGQSVYDSMFVWNEFLTRDIRFRLGSALWTVALVYGFFKQDKISVSGKDFILTIIARRSRHYAGTRYLKRGVNEKGRVANDVETEQIVFQDIIGESLTSISSVVQIRGSIPLFWSQEASKLNLRPDITLHQKDTNYDATRLHFQNLRNRYGNPIIILNLIKKYEKKPRESILRREFNKAINTINRDLPEEDHLKFLHWDLHMNLKSKAANVLSVLLKVALEALSLTGFFHCQVAQCLNSDMSLSHLKKNGGELAEGNSGSDILDDSYVLVDELQEDMFPNTDPSDNGILEDRAEMFGTEDLEEKIEISGGEISGKLETSGDEIVESHVVNSGKVEDKLETSGDDTVGDTLVTYGDEIVEDGPEISGSRNLADKMETFGESIVENKVTSDHLHMLQLYKVQKGVLRTNCIDCLDRTNVAQYAYGLAALGQQLHSLGVIETPMIDLDDPFAQSLMCSYEKMGDTLAIQYGGSAAHNKVFSHRRGYINIAIQSQEFFRTLQRHYNNAYMDTYKQAAINLFLGYFRPQKGKPAIWQLDSDPSLHAGENSSYFVGDSSRLIKRAQSDASIITETNLSLSGHISGQNGILNSVLNSAKNRPETQVTPPYFTDVVTADGRQFPAEADTQEVDGAEHSDDSEDSNFFDVCSITSNEDLLGGHQEISQNFVEWVKNGETFWY